MNNRNLILHNGQQMPIFGLGTFQIKDAQQINQVIRAALDAGYRYIDTAIFYENEAFIGETLQKIFQEGKYKREDLFIITKIFPYKSYNVKEKIQKSLQDLKLSYVDLLYLHWPIVGLAQDGSFQHYPIHQIWSILEECYRLGYTKSLGVSNFNVQSIMDLLSYCQVKPVCNQVEVNVYLQQPRLIQFCHRFNIHVVAYAPLARCGDILEDPELKQIAQKYNKTVTQIMLNFLLKQGLSVIPKTSNLDRLKENILSLEFELTQEDFEFIKTLNKNQRVCDPFHKELFTFIPLFD